MKVSQEKKAQTRRQLIDTAVDLFVDQGFGQTSMKQIARQAGVSSATIYNYFPNKDKLIIGFYESRATEALTEYRLTEGLEDYSFAERLQLLVDTYLEQLVTDREFVAMTVELFIRSPLTLLRDELTFRDAYRQEFLSLLAHAHNSHELPPLPLQNAIANLLCDYLLGITLYWIKDDSEGFSHTTQLTDLSVNLIDAAVKSGLIHQSFNVLGFLIKTHVVSSLANGQDMLSLLQRANIRSHRQP